MPTVLRNLKVNEGSVVDDGANPLARILLFKRGGEKNVQVRKDDKTPPHIGLSDSVKSEFNSQMKKDPVEDIASAMRRLSEWAAQGNYPTGLNYADLKWMYDQYADELHSRNPDSQAGGNFPAEKTEKSVGKSAVHLVKCKSLTDALATVKEAAEEKMGKTEKRSFGKRLVENIRKTWFSGEAWDWDGNGGPKTAHDFLAGLSNDDYSDALLGTASAMLADSVDSILDDPSVTDKKSAVSVAIQQYEQFLDAVGLLQSASTVAKAGRKISRDRMNQLKDLHQKLGDLINGADTGEGGSSGGDDDLDIDKSKLSPEVVKYLEDVEKRAKDAEAKVTELQKSAGGSPDPDDIWKGVSAAVRERVEKAEQRAKEAEEVAKRERDEREMREFITKAQSFRGLPVQAEDFAGVLKSIKKSAPDAYEKLEGVLTSADAAIVKGGVFNELGSAGSTTGSAAAQIEQLAKAKVEGSGGRMSIQKARTEVRKENRELAEREREERNA